MRRRRLRVFTLVVIAVVLVGVTGAVAALAVIQHRIAAQVEYLGDPFASLTTRPAAAGEAVTDGAAGTDGTAVGPRDGGATGGVNAVSGPAAEPAGAAPVNILVLGSDSRISAGDPSQWSYGAQRTDSIMLVHVAGDRSSVQVVSIPRDSWVTIPGHGSGKINAAYSLGGPSLTIQTVELLTGVRIDHFAIADFESFATLTDELGGVNIPLTRILDSGDVTLEPGLQLLSGAEALDYVRQRDDLPGGDLDRVQRQQAWLRAIAETAVSNGVTTDPFALTQTLELVAASVAVDDGFTVATMRDLAISLRDLQPRDLTFLTIPVTGAGVLQNGQSVVSLDREAMEELMAAVRADALPAYIDANPDLTVLGHNVP